MPLVLNYKGKTTLPLEVEGLTPEAVAGLSLAEIERFPIRHGSRSEPLAAWFDVSGSPTDGELRFVGDLGGVHWIGARLDAGTIVVEGHAGRHLGSQMAGGRILVSGNADDWLGCEMRGGLIHVRGNAGNHTGAAYRGSRRGMSGGTILIAGNVGNEAGHTMRRGTLAVGGNVGDGTGFNMIAGSIYVFGQCGAQTGAGMRRGTIGLLGTAAPTLLPTFRRASTYQPVFLRMALVELARLGLDWPRDLLQRRVTLYHGDFLALGRGEILVAEDR